MNKIYQRLAGYNLSQVLIAGFVATFLFWFMIFDDGSSVAVQNSNLDTEISKEEAKKKETDSMLKEEARMKEAVGALSQQYIEISRRLPTSLSSIDLNRQIDSFARNSGASIKSRKPLATLKDELVDRIPVEISLEGTYGELAQFVYLVAASERTAAIQSFSLTHLDKANRLKLEGVIVGYQLASEKPKSTDAGVKR